ncbi:MAG: DUF4271 domain-containing protein, partial [Bacteroidales bacterium]|nr:DUF4271 domain-containing protein [Bacteroidales bacterium]
MQIELLPDNTSKLIILTAAFVSLSLFAVLRHISSKYFVDMLHASVSGKKFEQLYLDNNVIVIKSDWIFAIITIINFGLVSFEFFNYKQVSITNNLISDFAVILAFVVLFFLLKYVFSFIIGFSFIETEYIKKYFYNVLTIYRALAMISFPLIIAIPFLSDSYLIY